MLVSRFGTSGALSECVFQRFVEANGDWFPLRFAQLEEARTEATRIIDRGKGLDKASAVGAFDSLPTRRPMAGTAAVGGWSGGDFVRCSSLMMLRGTEAAAVLGEQARWWRAYRRPPSP